ncbi:MAG TPA: chondroitinase-B domain-containing protein, partial [Vicinamibacterales bacterium]|nr:chondroitinase-B domain-containing protein [Vicinamibacterales bacterium]
MKSKIFVLVGALLGVLNGALPARASDWYVAPGGAGSGTSGAPFGRVQDALNVAQAGDTIIVRPGTYNETLTTIRAGAAGAPIVIRAEQGPGTVLVTALGRVATINHPYTIVDGFIFDGQYGPDRTIRVTSTANFLVLRNTEVRRASRNVLEIFGPTGVLIENCLIHHALQFDPIEGRLDAHGISAGPVHDLTIRNTEIHTFSGDGLQVDPGRSAPGWTNVLVEHSRIWLQPLPAAENGFPAGVVPGENAIDTKAGSGFPRATIVLRDIVASGFKDLPSSVPPNQAAFNLKENIDAIVDGVTVYDSEIAFRLRAPALVLVKNAVVFNTLKAVRYENDITNLRFWNNTIGVNVPTVFEAASASPSGLDIRNLLVLGPLPPEASGGSNLSVDAGAFVNAAANDYHLAAGSSAID